MDLCISCLPFQHNLVTEKTLRQFIKASSILGVLLPEIQAFAIGSFKKKSQPDHLLFKVPIQVLGDISVAEVLFFPESTPVSQTFQKENFEIILKAQIFLYSWMAFYQL